MTGSLRNHWPLYLVTVLGEVIRMPVTVEHVILVSASFTFARFCHHLEEKQRRVCGILRVTYYNRTSPVKQHSGTFVQNLDKNWCEPPSVIAAAHCTLCVKLVRASARILEGVNCGAFGTPCQAHELHWSPQLTHEQLPLNALCNHCPEGCTATACDALRATKAAWLGPLYFARVMRNSFPHEVLDFILYNATSCEDMM